MSIKKIVLTGGPCAGKTTLLAKIQETLSGRGYTVLVIPEAATELIPNGIRPGVGGMTMVQFQEFVLRYQLAAEDNYQRAAEMAEAAGQKVLIVCDRGLMDGSAYVPDGVFDSVLGGFGLGRGDAFARYDGVIHLVTAAAGAELAYTTANNLARRETAEEARAVDLRTMAAWVGHPHLRVISNDCGMDFDNKMNRAMQAILDLLGEPVPIEIEKKFVIKYPSQETLRKLGAVKSSIIQTYLKSNGNVERRVRQRGVMGGTSYYYTEKWDSPMGGRYENERLISHEEYIRLLLEMADPYAVVVKDRYCFVYAGQYFELDIYPTNSDVAILEIELSTLASEVDIPAEISVIREVTGSEEYSNHTIAMRGNRLPESMGLDLTIGCLKDLMAKVADAAAKAEQSAPKEEDVRQCRGYISALSEVLEGLQEQKQKEE